MAKRKWWKYKKQNPLKDFIVVNHTDEGQYNATFTGTDWQLGGVAPPTVSWTTTTATEPIHVLGLNRPIDFLSGHSTTTLTNTITIPYESVETAGGVYEFLIATMPDGYALLEYNSEMSEDMITISYSSHVSPVITANAVGFNRAEVDEEALRGILADGLIIDEVA